ncbi:uncharacterized protein K02A2.6-like [Pararge aegeria]|uniref:uncharacterized protein K02A2.6-like n=1 Tax=Pararge aegeria TaxID=116150 RepID=UPI0019D1AE5D|nr:uncharacterized protein K02A2.6-like [Pararge aegeria]
MSVGRLGEFNLSSGTWTTYIERMEQYFLANDVKVNLQVPTLLACVGDATYELMVDLCSPRKPGEMKFSELVQLVKKHIQPTPSVLAERYKFRKRTQTVNETVAQFAAALKHLARDCEFKDNLEENLRDQFVCGLSSESTRQRLFCEDSVTFTVAFKKAVALEAAANDAAVVEQQAAEGAVHAVQARGARAAVAVRGAAPRWRGEASSSRVRYSGGYTNNRDRSIKLLCACCGSREHTRLTCKYADWTCRICLKPGHLKRVCPNVSKKPEGQVLRLDTARSGVLNGCDDISSEHASSAGEYDDEGTGGPSGLYMVQLTGSEPVMAEVTVAKRRLTMHVDTGSPISCIGNKMYTELFSDYRLQDNSYKLKSYDGSVIKCIGYIKVPVSYGPISENLNLYIIQNGGVPLLGREWLTKLSLSVIVPKSVLAINNDKRDNVGGVFDKTRFMSKYPAVFSGKLGCLRSQRATLRVRAGAAPVFRRARPLPLALRADVDAELQRMQAAGIIQPVPSSDWASCLVVVLKNNGALRICGDYKSTINPMLEIDKYPLPRSEVLFNNLNGGKRFTKIDLSEAYSQVTLDESKKYTVVNTHRGLYVYNRLVYGLASAPSIFQRIMEQLVVGIPNVSIFLDDILITGKTEHEHVRNLHSVFERLAKEGLTVRQEKCNFFEKEVSYLGFIISEHGVRTDDRKTEAVVKAPKPENITELKSFLGMVNFYAKFIKNISILLAPLYALLRKGVEWQWTEAQDRAFQEVKAALTSCPVLLHYDERLPLIVSCDASARGVGAVLSQRGEGGERPVSYASRTLNSAECNYSQIQREALAIIFAVKKFHTYLYGRRFVLRTDHQPLIAIFGSKKDIPHMASGRLIRWAILLSGYQYDIEYVQSKANSADALSRLPIDTGEENNDANTFIKFIENKFPIDSNQIKIESGKDKCISRILEFVKTGWPKSGFKEPDQEMTAYWRRREELYVENGCLMWGCRVVVPRALRPAVLAELHGSHLGMVKCKGLARSFVFWPGLDNDLERMCSACRTCGEVADLPPKAPVVPWSWPSNPFDRVHIDFFSFRNITYLILVDAYSKWIEVSPMSTKTASNTTLKLKEIFSRFGICRVLVSDNGPPFSSEEFKLFLKNNGIKHVTSAPYHPASNGEVENAVRTVKRSLKKADVEKICRKGQNMYEVETVEGLRWNRHTDQLRSNSAVDDRDSSTRDGQPTVSAQAALADYAIAGNEAPFNPAKIRTQRCINAAWRQKHGNSNSPHELRHKKLILDQREAISARDVIKGAKGKEVRKSQKSKKSPSQESKEPQEQHEMVEP